MKEISIWDANRNVESELQRVSQELGDLWDINHYVPLGEMPDKNYTARGGSHLLFNTCLAEGQLVTVLFQPGDSTGNVPRPKQGEAELYIALGSSVDGKWFSGLTSLDAVSSNIKTYKQLTMPAQEYIEALSGKRKNPDKRFDFTFDRDEGYGNPHVIGFQPYIPVAGSLDIDYQVGAFVNFPRKCEELDILREKVRTQ